MSALAWPRAEAAPSWRRNGLRDDGANNTRPERRTDGRAGPFWMRRSRRRVSPRLGVWAFGRLGVWASGLSAPLLPSPQSAARSPRYYVRQVARLDAAHPLQAEAPHLRSTCALYTSMWSNFTALLLLCSSRLCTYP